MDLPRFDPREGGVKIVFDVPAAEVDEVAQAVTAAGFRVDPYYRGARPRVGGAADGLVRLGAEKPLHEFTEAEQDVIVAEFDALQTAAGFTGTRVGTDIWTAGGDGGLPSLVPAPTGPPDRAGSAELP